MGRATTPAQRMLAAVIVATALGACSDDPDGGLPIAIDPGGPYRATVGETVVLQASVSLDGHAELIADLDAIGAAFEHYRAEHGAYPPGALTDAAGTPLLSWRVLLLPYLGDDAAALYSQFDLTKAWDDPANAGLIEQIPAVYRGGENRPAGDTSYAGVAGPKTVLGLPAATLGGGVALADVTDGANMTVVAGPVASGVSIAWTAPDDLGVNDAIRLGAASGYSAPGGIGTPLLFLDGAVRTMANTTDPSVVTSWTTFAGDTCIPPEGVDMEFYTQWDLDDDGKFEQQGMTATLVDVPSGERDVAVQVIDDLGGIHTTTVQITGVTS